MDTRESLVKEMVDVLLKDGYFKVQYVGPEVVALSIPERINQAKKTRPLEYPNQFSIDEKNRLAEENHKRFVDHLADVIAFKYTYSLSGRKVVDVEHIAAIIAKERG